MRSSNSYSSYSTYNNCPAAWRLAYGTPVYRHPDERLAAWDELAAALMSEDVDFAAGEAIQELLDEVRSLRPKGDPGVTPPALRNGSLNHEFAARYGAWCYQKKRTCDLEFGRELALGYEEPVRSIMEGFVDNWRFDWGSTVVEGAAPVEQEFRAMLPDGRTVFSGHIDLLQKYDDAATPAEDPFGADDGVAPGDDAEEGDGALYVITDLKTSLYGEWDEFTPPKQLQWYAWLVQNAVEVTDGGQRCLYPGARSFELRLYSLRTNYTVSWRIGGDLSYLGRELQAIHGRIEEDTEFEAVPGEACLKCLHVHACPVRDSATLQNLTGTTPEQQLELYFWHKAQYTALNELLKDHVKLTDETVYLNGKALYGTREAEEGVKVTDFPGLVALAVDADEALRTPRSRLPGVARMLKVEKDVARLLLDSPTWQERALRVMTIKPAGKPIIGVLGKPDDNETNG